MKRNSREHSLENLRQELIEAGLDIPDEDVLKRKVKNLKNSYRIELNKVKKSKKSGADRTRLTIGLLQLARVNSLRVTGYYKKYSSECRLAAITRASKLAPCDWLLYPIYSKLAAPFLE